MKMKKSIFVLAFFSCIVGFSFGQKVKLVDDIAFVDGNKYIYYKKQNMANDASVRGVNAGHEELFLTYVSYKDKDQATSGNPEGWVRWMEFNFLDLGIKCEVKNHSHKDMVKLMFDNKLFVNGVIDPSAAQRFVDKYGMRFTENRRNTNVNIIINN